MSLWTFLQLFLRLWELKLKLDLTFTMFSNAWCSYKKTSVVSLTQLTMENPNLQTIQFLLFYKAKILFLLVFSWLIISIMLHNGSQSWKKWICHDVFLSDTCKYICKSVTLGTLGNLLKYLIPPSVVKVVKIWLNNEHMCCVLTNFHFFHQRFLGKVTVFQNTDSFMLKARLFSAVFPTCFEWDKFKHSMDLTQTKIASNPQPTSKILDYTIVYRPSNLSVSQLQILRTHIKI